VIAAALLLALATAAPAAADCGAVDVQPDAAGISQASSATLCLLNQQRSANGLAALSESRTLDETSLAHTQDMVSNQYFAHTSPAAGDLVSRLTAAGYIDPTIDWSVGENIGWGTGSLSTPAQMVNAWMNSPEHRANILDATYSQIGLGIAAGVPTLDSGGLAGATYTTDFGDRSAPATSSPAAQQIPVATPAASSTKHHVLAPRHRRTAVSARANQRHKSAVHRHRKRRRKHHR
jgi:uncharacterized protein YkwD